MQLIPSTHSEAVYRLRAFQPHAAFNRYHALEFLEERFSLYRFLALYQAYFPKQFAASCASMYAVGERHSDREIEFFQLLGKHCFPVPFWMAERAFEERIEAIPVLDMGVNWQGEDSLESLLDEWKIFIPLTSVGRYWFESVDQDCIGWYEEEFGIAVHTIQHPDLVSQKLFRKRCIKAGSPFKFLPLTLNLLNKSTGNVWLDECDDEAFYESDWGTKLPWSEGSIQFLTQQWKQAEHILNLCCMLTDWLKKDLSNHFKYLLKLWNQPYPKR